MYFEKLTSRKLYRGQQMQLEENTLNYAAVQ